MEGANDSGKGNETWRTESSEAEKLFVISGFAQRDAKTIWSPAFFKKPQLESYVGYSQSMLYNANKDGWDTLNWKTRPVQYGDDATESGGGLGIRDILKLGKPANRPPIFINWASKTGTNHAFSTE